MHSQKYRYCKLFKLKNIPIELRYYFYDGAEWLIWTTSDANLTTGWHHIVVDYDGTNEAVFYVDNIVATSSQTTGTANSSIPTDNTNTIIVIACFL